MEFKVTKCVCYDMTFRELKEIMKKNDLKTIGELREIKPVGTNCKLCVPYIKRMISTGEIEFELILKK